MNRAGNTYWLTNRQTNAQVAGQSVPTLAPRELSRELIPATLSGLRLIPSWILLAMILTATVGICSTVILRSREELKAATLEFSRMSSEISSMNRSNASLQIEIRRIATDPITIESAARERLSMVRPTDIVVPVEQGASVSNFGTLSFVR